MGVENSYNHTQNNTHSYNEMNGNANVTEKQIGKEPTDIHTTRILLYIEFYELHFSFGALHFQMN